MADIYNSTSNTLFSGTNGKDAIRNYGTNVSIDAGAGNNKIYSSGSNVLIKVSGGRNTVQGEVTVNMGAGNSTLIGDRNTQVYQYVGGNNVITNYSHEDVIEISSGKIDSYSFDGGDLIFHIGDGSVRLRNMTNHAITVKDSLGSATTKIYSNGYSPQQVIKNFVKSIANTALSSRLKLDEAIQACSQFNSLQEVIDKMVSDCEKARGSDTFLRDYCGIILDNEDTGSILGWDVGGLSAKSVKNLYTTKGEAVYPSSTTFTIRGLTITVPEKDSLSEYRQLLVKGFYSWWAEDAIKLVEEAYGIHFNGQKISLSFLEDRPFAEAFGDKYDIAFNVSHDDPEGIVNYLNKSEENLRYFKSAIIAHEMTHVMQGNFGLMSQSPLYMLEGMADLTAAGNLNSMTKLASNYTKLAAYLDINNHFSEDSNVYAAGYMFWRYLMKQTSDSYDSSKDYTWKDNSYISGTSKDDFLTGSGKNQTLRAGKGNDTITAYGENTTVVGGSGDDYIAVNGTALSVDGGAGDDSISNYDGGNYVTLLSGAGDDSIYNSGSNVTLDAGAGKDFISNSNSSVKINAGADDDNVYNTGSNVTIDGGEGNDFIHNYG